MCTHITEESPLSSVVTRCLKCFSPSFMVEFPEKCEYLFEKLLMKLVTYKKLAASVADLAKGEFSKFCETVLVENKEEFLSFDKDKDRLDYFLWKFTDLKMYAKLQHVLSLFYRMDKHKLNKDSAATKVWLMAIGPLIPSWLFVLSQVPWPKGTWSWNDKRCIGKLQAGKNEIFWRSTIKSPICWENRESGSKKQSQWEYWNSQYWNLTDVICDWESKEAFWWNWISCCEKDSLRLVPWYWAVFNSFSDIKHFNFILKFKKI